MRRVAQQQAPCHPTCQGEHLTVTIAPVGFAKKFSIRFGMSRSASGNCVFEKRQYLRFGIERCETDVVTLERQEQNASEGAVDVRQRDQHERAARPDVKCMRFENVSAVGPGWNGQLFVTIIEVLLREVEARQLQHLSCEPQKWRRRCQSQLRNRQLDSVPVSSFRR